MYTQKKHFRQNKEILTTELAEIGALRSQNFSIHGGRERFIKTDF